MLNSDGNLDRLVGEAQNCVIVWVGLRQPG